MIQRADIVFMLHVFTYVPYVPISSSVSIFPFGIVALHVFDVLGCEVRKMANEENKLPTVIVLHDVVRITPRRHSRQTNAIFDDVVEFAVG